MFDSQIVSVPIRGLFNLTRKAGEYESIKEKNRFRPHQGII